MSDQSMSVERSVGEGVPRVSIGVPVFNGAPFLAKTLESLLSQTFSDFEIVISDNASTDRTEEICRAYASREPRIRYYRNDINLGAVWNHNRVFELAKGEFFKWNSADDLCASEFLARCVAALDQNPAAVMAVSEPAEIDEHEKPLESRTVPNQTLLPAVPPDAPPHVRFRQNIRLDHLCLSIYSLIRSDVLRRTGPMGGYADSDRVLLAHLALFGPCIILPETLLLNRDHAGRFSRSYNRDYEGWRERANWMDPDNAKHWVFPFWKELAELLRIVRLSPLKWNERLRCYGEIVRWLRYKGHIRRLYIDATHYPRKWVVRRFPWAKAGWNWLWGKRGDVGPLGSAQSAHKVGSQSASSDKS
jgi:glycosyltransferase involved in cell wall biosynthesis